MPPTSTTITANVPGTYVLEDDGIPGNNFSQIRFPNGTIVPFEHPTDDLIFEAVVAGVQLIVNTLDSLGTADFRVGDLANAALTPDFVLIDRYVSNAYVNLVSNTTILERGADSAADIRALSVTFSAQTGVGTAGNAIETQVGTLEAETDTGGIRLSNFGTVALGGLTDLVDGLDVSTSGDIHFTNQGTILISDLSAGIGSGESIHGGTTSGNVTLIASGFDSDIIPNVDITSIEASRGSVALTAGRDIAFGIIGANFNNDVIANGSLTMTAGRDVIADGFADLASDAFFNATGGGVTVNAGRDINVLNIAGTSASIGASGSSGADVVLTTGIDGTLNLSANSVGALFSSSGNITVNADRVLIDVGSGMSTFDPAAQIILRPVTSGRETILGSLTDGPLALELSDAELDRLSTANLVLGSDTAGNLQVTSAISPALAANLTLRSGEDISVLADIATSASVALRAGNNVWQNSGSTITTTTLSAFVDTLGDDPGTGGTAYLGTVAATGIAIVGNADADWLRGTAGNDIFDGKGGADTTIGLGGDDWYYVINSGDIVVEILGEGANDRVLASVSYTLATGVDVERLTTNDNLATTAINLTGNEIANVIYGNAGANTLNGMGGADTLIGLGGNDFLYVDSASDDVIEGAAEGAADRIFASVNYAMDAGVHVEILSTTNSAGATAINLTGNEFGNTLVGNAGANVLNGAGGNDAMVGLAGDDWFFVDSAGDVVAEGAAEGANDRIFASASYTMGAGVHVERLSTNNNAGTGAINLTGNELANLIYGNAGNNVIAGAAGADTMIGLGGDDSYIVINSGDIVVEGAAEGANDRIFASTSYTQGAGVHVERLTTDDNLGVAAINLTGNELANLIYGNAGANILDGKAGTDTLVGLEGADSFAFTTALGAGNIDVVSGFVVADDTIRLENAVFTGLATGALAAGAYNTGAAASQADDRVIYNNATGALLFDADGLGGAAGVQFATVSAGLAMTAADFLVI